MYHPVLGRFLTRDPLPMDGEPVLMGADIDGIGSMTDEWDEPTNDERTNLYAYVGNSPTNYVDPSGLKYGSPGGRSKPKNNCPPGCTQKEKDAIIAKLMAAQKEASKRLPWGRKNLKEHCDNWEQLFEKILWEMYGDLWPIPSSACVVKAEVIQLRWMLIAGHAAYQVTFCDGTTIYIDNGTGGNGSGLFYPCDLNTIGLHHRDPCYSFPWDR
jgi:hypothetical protein